jgi:hypothetical protein
MGLHNALDVSNADIDDEDLADITDWTDSDSGTGDSSQATFDSKSCMKLLTGAANGTANRNQDIGSFGTRTVFSMNIYFDALGTTAADDKFILDIYGSSLHFYFVAGTDGLFIINSAGSLVEVGTNLIVQDVWQEWTLDVNWSAGTVDVYLDKVLKAAGVDCNYADAGTNGLVTFRQQGVTTANRLTYIDWFKAGSYWTSAPVTTELTPTINSADTYETKTWDISGVADADKNAIDKLIFTQANADSATTWYVDNFETTILALGRSWGCIII